MRAAAPGLVFRRPVAYPGRAGLCAPAETADTREGSGAMPKIKHIAIATQDADKTARFYIDVFGLKEIGKVDSPNASGYYLSDGDINMAILNFKNDQVAGERGKEYSGIHHIGFQVESLEEMTAKLAAAGSEPMHSVNQALGVGMGGHGGQHSNVEVKYTGPDGVMVDVSQTGWVGTSPLPKKEGAPA
jgi:glyoxylase I family protein